MTTKKLSVLRGTKYVDTVLKQSVFNRLVELVAVRLVEETRFWSSILLFAPIQVY